jgi:spore maturation protein CgeB
MGLVIVGYSGGTHVAQSLFRAATEMGIQATLCGAEVAWSPIRILNALSWRLREKRPPFDAQFQRRLLHDVKRTERAIVITTGMVPVLRKTLAACRNLGAKCLHFSTDDPWNPAHKSTWHYDALEAYDIVFTSRRQNIDDLLRLPCRDVRYLPFAYDPHLLSPTDLQATIEIDALFVGGADADRASFFRRYLAAGGPAKFVGGYWDRYRDMRAVTLGKLSPGVIAALTRSAKVNLILVRRANRDGHVMRSFEAGALGGSLLVEWTNEHQCIFGPDRDTVRYFRSPEDAAAICRELLNNSIERVRLSAAVKARITGGRNTYRDRLDAMLQCAGKLKPGLTENEPGAPA